MKDETTAADAVEIVLEGLVDLLKDMADGSYQKGYTRGMVDALASFGQGNKVKPELKT